MENSSKRLLFHGRIGWWAECLIDKGIEENFTDSRVYLVCGNNGYINKQRLLLIFWRRKLLFHLHCVVQKFLESESND